MKSGYKILNNKTWKCGEYAIESVRTQDAELIRQWRNEQISALRQSKELSKNEQESYFKNFVIRDSII